MITTSQKQEPSLLFCIAMDLIGYASFAIPGLGEFSDVFWAPLSAYIFFKTFGGWKGAFGSVFNFVEEVLPFTDFIPSFSIMWAWQYFTRMQNSTDGSNVPSQVKGTGLLKA